MKSRNQSEATAWIIRTMRFTLFSSSYGPNTTNRINGMDGNDFLVGGAGNDSFGEGAGQYRAWADKPTVFKHFNGRTFNAVSTGVAENDAIWKVAA